MSLKEKTNQKEKRGREKTRINMITDRTGKSTKGERFFRIQQKKKRGRKSTRETRRKTSFKEPTERSGKTETGGNKEGKKTHSLGA